MTLKDQISLESSEFKRLVDDAKTRSGSKISYEKCYERLSQQSTTKMMEELKTSLRDCNCTLDEATRSHCLSLGFI